MKVGLAEKLKVTLAEKPDGCTVRDAPVTISRTYDVLYIDGSAYCITTDRPGETATIHRGRFRPPQA